MVDEPSGDQGWSASPVWWSAAAVLEGEADADVVDADMVDADEVDADVVDADGVDADEVDADGVISPCTVGPDEATKTGADGGDPRRRR